MRLFGVPHLFEIDNLQEISHNLARLPAWLSRFSKRTFDLLVSFLALVLLSPFFFLIAIAIKRDSPGPAFYRGDRVGLSGKRFKILKFRTMYETPSSYTGPKVTSQDDTRITSIGHWLRDTKLNELPQLWNVFKGEMSLVGPRPEDPSIAKTWPNEVWKEVLSVRPGITSPASIHYRNEESLLTFRDVLQKYLHELGPDKIRLDQLYVRYRSFWLDLDVLLWTSLILIPRIRYYTPPETLIFVGPITRLIRRYLSWFSIDLVVTLASIGFTGLIWRAFVPLDVGLFNSIALAIGFALLFSLSGTIFGVNRITWSKATYKDVYDLFPAWIIASTIALTINYFAQVFPEGLILMASTIALGSFVFVRYRTRLVIGVLSRIIRFRSITHTAAERILIVGSGRTAEHIAWLLSHPSYSHKFQVVGFVVDDLMTMGMRMYGSQIIGTKDQVPQLVKKHDIGIIIMADHRMGCEEFQSIACTCKEILIKVVVIPDIFGSLNGLVESSPVVQPLDMSSSKIENFRCEHCLARYASVETESSNTKGN